MSWFEKIMPSRIKTERRTRSVPEGLWIKCPACDAVLYRAELERNLYVCPKCSHHMRIGGARPPRALPRSRREQSRSAREVTPEDPLKFRDSKRYSDRLAQAQKATGESDALMVLAGTLHELPIVACAFEFQFLGGSMGSVVGERFKRGVDHCIEHAKRFVCFSASGGARMQEALYSLMQMAKTAAALSRLAQAHMPYISVMTDPTTGGVSASLAMLGDLNIAEPRALIGFAGPRVIQQTVRETLPEGFQRSEFLLEHGAIDMIVDRREMRDKVGALLRLLLKLPAAARPSARRARYPMRTLAEWLDAAGVGASAELSTWDSSASRRVAERSASPCRVPRHHRRRHEWQRSAVAHLEALLSARRTTGAFTSPHFIRYSERIRDRRRRGHRRGADCGVRAHRGGARRRPRSPSSNTTHWLRC